MYDYRPRRSTLDGSTPFRAAAFNINCLRGSDSRSTPSFARVAPLWRVLPRVFFPRPIASSSARSRVDVSRNVLRCLNLNFSVNTRVFLFCVVHTLVVLKLYFVRYKFTLKRAVDQEMMRCSSSALFHTSCPQSRARSRHLRRVRTQTQTRTRECAYTHVIRARRRVDSAMRGRKHARGRSNGKEMSAVVPPPRRNEQLSE